MSSVQQVSLCMHPEPWKAYKFREVAAFTYLLYATACLLNQFALAYTFSLVCLQLLHCQQAKHIPDMHITSKTHCIDSTGAAFQSNYRADARLRQIQAGVISSFLAALAWHRPNPISHRSLCNVVAHIPTATTDTCTQQLTWNLKEPPLIRTATRKAFEHDTLTLLLKDCIVT